MIILVTMFVNDVNDDVNNIFSNNIWWQRLIIMFDDNFGNNVWWECLIISLVIRFDNNIGVMFDSNVDENVW